MCAEATMDAAPVTMERVLQRENLHAAWLAVKSNHGAAGVDGRSISETETHLRENWESIQERLSEGTYRPGAVRAVIIPKANAGERQLGIPNVQDRLIQQAIHQRLSDVCEDVFNEHSYGFRPKRSAHDAVLVGQSYIKEGKQWVVDIDLKSFFDEVNHDILMHQLRALVADKLVRKLIGSYLRAPIQDAEGRRVKRAKGTPQGGPLSPLLANIYLDPLDKELERRGLSFVRYADDITIYVSSARSAQRVLVGIVEWIEKHLRIPVNRDKSGHGPSDKSAFLGFRLYGDGKIGIAAKSLKRLKENVRRLWHGGQSLTSNELREQWHAYIMGWWNYFSLADQLRELRNLSGWIRRHMRKCFWLRWKTPAGRINALRKLGVNERACGIGYTGLGAWRVARLWAMNQALNNRTLNRHGFIIPWT